MRLRITSRSSTFRPSASTGRARGAPLSSDVNFAVEFLAIAVIIVIGLWCFALAVILYGNLILKEAGLSIPQRHVAVSGLSGLVLFPIIIPAGFAVPVPLPLAVAGPIVLLDGDVWDLITVKSALLLGLFTFFVWLVCLPFVKISARYQNEES